MRSLTKRFTVGCAICALLLAEAGAVGDSVLCLSADGHRAIEMAVNGKCCPSSGPEGKAGPLRVVIPCVETSPGHGSCLNCTDIPLPSVSATAAPTCALKLHQLILASNGVWGTAGERAFGTTPILLANRHAPPIDSAFPVRTVQLLI